MGKGTVNERSKAIIKYNLIGIIMNLLLSIAKIVVGAVIKSKAYLLDGINSLADMLSSVVSLLSVHYGGKTADKNHPLGFGRLEYMSSLVITIAIIYIGVSSLFSAISLIMNPKESQEYGTFVIAIMVVSLLSKLIYGSFSVRKGRQVKSIALRATGVDSITDAMMALSILIGIFISKIIDTDVEGILCLLISLMIIRTGLLMIRESVDKLLGTRIDPELKKNLCRMIAMEREVYNVSNLVVHNYGEDLKIGSVDIEVDEKLTASQISNISRRIIKKAERMGVVITSVGISGTNLSDKRAIGIWDGIIKLCQEYEGIIRVQSFVIDLDKKEFSFYVVQDYSIKDRHDEINKFSEKVCNAYPDYKIEIMTAIDM